MNRRTVVVSAASSCLMPYPSRSPAMSSEEQPTGIVLPMAIVQPFELQFLRYDIHAMAWLQGHSEYEAIEALILRQPNSSPLIRIILTRHNQSQIDHMNDQAAVDAVLRSAVSRETIYTSTSFEEFAMGELQGFHLSFTSFRGETIEFKAQAASYPEVSRGGLTDPGRHSITTSLPVMLRGKSAVLGARSEVIIAGQRQTIAVNVSIPPYFVGLNGSFTEDFRMGIVRAGTRHLTLVEKPSTISVGSTWIYERPFGGTLVYRVTDQLREGQFRAVMSETGIEEEAVIRPIPGGLFLLSVRRVAKGYSRGAFTLKFGANSAYTLGIDEQANLLDGKVTRQELSDGQIDFELLPRSPVWALQRAPKLSLHQNGRLIQISTSLQTVG